MNNPLATRNQQLATKPNPKPPILTQSVKLCQIVSTYAAIARACVAAFGVCHSFKIGPWKCARTERNIDSIFIESAHVTITPSIPPPSNAAEVCAIGNPRYFNPSNAARLSAMQRICNPLDRQALYTAQILSEKSASTIRHTLDRRAQSPIIAA